MSGEKEVKDPCANGSLPRTGSRIFAKVTEKKDVPLLFREPHVNTGFRQVHQDWHRYLFSVFQIHNECLNTWTHLLALAMVIYKTWHYSDEMDFVNDPHMWPFAFLVLTTIVLYICSSGAHCLQNRSELAHYTSFMVDYAGIGFYSFGSIVAHYYYCTERNFYNFGSHFFVELGGILAINVGLSCIAAKMLYDRPYPPQRRLLQMTSVGLVYVYLNLPILQQLYSCYAYDHKCDESISLHSAQIVSFVASAFFFGSDIPQRFFPGKCDFIGHSHQLFHLCILLTTYFQFEAVVVDIKNDHVDLKSRPDPTLCATFGYGGLVWLCEMAIVAVARQYAIDKKVKVKFS